MREHVKKLKGELVRRGLDAFLAFKNVRYLAGTTAGKVVIIPRDGDPVLLCSRLELGRVELESWIRDIRAFSGWKAPLRRGERVHFLELWQLVAGCLDELGAQAVGYDAVRGDFVRKLRNVHAASYREMPEIVQEMRKIKSRGELALLRKSARIATLGMGCAEELIEPNRTELEIAAEAEHEMRRAGSEGTPFPTIVASGRNSWLPHATAMQKKLKRGELVVVDMGAIFNGYASDMTRTFALGPTPRQIKLVELIKRAQAAAMRLVKSGGRASVIDKTARKIVSRAGYARFCPHGTGHGVGMEVHEPPSLAPDSKDILRERMVITVEPGVYVPRLGGARWEDMVLVTKSGHELMTG